MTRQLGRAVAVLAVVVGAALLGACGGGGGGSGGDDPEAAAPDSKDVKTEGVLAAAGTKPVELGGLDTPTKLDGKCFSEFVLVSTGADAGGVQRYTLSFHLKGDPKDSAALYEFLDKNKCGEQQEEAWTKAAQAIGFVPDGNKTDPIDISFRTSSGRRLFL